MLLSGCEKDSSPKVEIPDGKFLNILKFRGVDKNRDAFFVQSMRMGNANSNWS